MKYTEIDRQDWTAFFDMIRTVMTGRSVELEVAGLDIGDQIAIEWTGLDALSYDSKTDKITVDTVYDSHEIERPIEIVVIEDEVYVRMLTVRDSIGHVQIIRFREPVMLMAPRTMVS